MFEELYPHRRPLYLTPRNECNVPKLVCSTIRPTQVCRAEGWCSRLSTVPTTSTSRAEDGAADYPLCLLLVLVGQRMVQQTIHCAYY